MVQSSDLLIELDKIAKVELVPKTTYQLTSVDQLEEWTTMLEKWPGKSINLDYIPTPAQNYK